MAVLAGQTKIRLTKSGCLDIERENFTNPGFARWATVSIGVGLGHGFEAYKPLLASVDEVVCRSAHRDTSHSSGCSARDSIQ